MRLRWIAIGVAVAMIVAAGLLEIKILERLEEWKEIGNFIVLLGIAPILSITSIVTFILIGAFKNPGDAEVNLSSILQAAQSVTGTQE